MAYRAEVSTARGWVVVDEERGIVGERMPSRALYERRLLRAQPILRTREYRITEFDAPKIKTLFTLSVPL